jgi:serine/threonine protein kinase
MTFPDSEHETQRLTRPAREAECPEPSRFWDVALGGSWRSDEILHVAACQQCQSAERAVRSVVGGSAAGDPALHETTGLGQKSDGRSLEPEGQSLHALEVSDPCTESTCADRTTGYWATKNSHVDVTRDRESWTSGDQSVTREPTGQTPGWSGLPPRVGDYEVLQLAGCGGMGVVYKVRDCALERDAALKVIRHFGPPDGEVMDRFFRAARLWARLDHPAIVPIYHVGQLNGMPYVVSKFIEGPNLSVLLSHSDGIPAHEAARIIAEVADALHFAHEHRVIHRDVKPSNIMMGDDRHPILTDFGLARSLSAGDEASVTFEGQIVGTPAYMSPEQVDGRLDAIGPASDIYSLGATLYSLLAGRPPFRGGSVMETLRQVRETEPEPLRRLNPTVPRDLEAICLKALGKHPTERYTSAQAMSEDLRRFLAACPVLARRPGKPERLARWLRRHPAWLAVLFLSLASFMLVAYQQSRLLQEGRRRLEAESRSELRRVINHPTEVELCREIQLDESHIQEQPEVRHRLASMYHRLGDLHVTTDCLVEAVWAYEKAVSLLRQQLRDDTRDSGSRVEMADILGNLGEVSWILGRKRDAREAYREAVIARRHLVVDHPEILTHRDALARTLDRLNELSGVPPTSRHRSQDHRILSSTLE